MCFFYYLREVQLHFKRTGYQHGTASEYVEKLLQTMGVRNRAANVIKAQLLSKCGMQQLRFFKHQFMKSEE